VGSWDSICGIENRLMGWTTEESVILGQRQDIFCPQRGSDWLWVPPSLLFNVYNAVMRFWPLKNLAEFVDGPNLCRCAALFCP